MTRTKSVNDLLQGYARRQEHDAQISGLSLDSRKLKSNFAFVALKGTNTHGLSFAVDALEKGANSIIYEEEESPERKVPKNTCLFPVRNLSRNISKIAAKFYEYPSAALQVFAVTGTNGKSSIAYGLADVLNQLGQKTAVLGTIGFNPGSDIQPASHTTPDAISLQEFIKEARDSASKCLVMEASSHGLAQYRLDGVEVDTAIYTNLSHEHQDYHPGMQHYAESKERLLQFPSVKSALINIGDKFGAKLADKYKNKLRVVVYGVDIKTKESASFLNARNVKLDKAGLEFKLVSSWGEAMVASKHFGRFNVENLLAIIGACLLGGFSLAEITKSIMTMDMVPGRMQSFKKTGRPLVVVDFAHTPDALDKALTALRDHIGLNARIYCVFGCGGDRDQAKRPLMGEVAEFKANFTILTDDNPRSEKSHAIIQHILAGFKLPKRVKVITDRKQAILYAIDKARDNDVVLIAGKGHEAVQIADGVEFEFDDAKVVEGALC